MTNGIEPTDEVPESVLRELQTVFADPEDLLLEPVPPRRAPAPTSPKEEPVEIERVALDEPILPIEVDVPDPSPVPVIEPVPVGDAAESPSGTPRATIVIGGGDELPDALYLDDVAEERLREVHGGHEASESGGTTIIIGGDELDSSGAYDAVSVPKSMDPRVRARRIAVKRAAGRRRLLWVAVVLFVVVLIVGALAVFSSSLFAVEDVRVQGATYTQFYDAEELQSVINDLVGEPILLVDTLAAERRLEQIPWIERAIVTTDFPHDVMIDVRERQPLASFKGSDGRYRIIDHDGRVLDVLDGRPADYMLLAGQAPDSERGTLAGAPYAAGAQMVAALPSEIRDLTLSASVDAGTGDLGLVLQPNIEVRIGSFDGLDAKLARLLQQVRDGLLGIVKLDVSTPEVSVTRG